MGHQPGSPLQLKLILSCLLLEEWRPAHRYASRIEVSNYGRVRRSAGRKKLRKFQPKHNGYWVVSIGINHKLHRPTVHSLVLEAFKCPRPEGMHAMHLNGNRWDNRADNLEWGPPALNNLHRAGHGTMPRGVTASKTRLTRQKVGQIIKLHEAGATPEVLARRFGVHTATIYDILAGRSWSAVTGIDSPSCTDRGQGGVSC